VLFGDSRYTRYISVNPSPASLEVQHNTRKRLSIGPYMCGLRNQHCQRIPHPVATFVWCGAKRRRHATKADWKIISSCASQCLSHKRVVYEGENSGVYCGCWGGIKSSDQVCARTEVNLVVRREKKRATNAFEQEKKKSALGCIFLGSLGLLRVLGRLLVGQIRRWGSERVL
jgi:hypothetical protein